MTDVTYDQKCTELHNSVINWDSPPLPFAGSWDMRNPNITSIIDLRSILFMTVEEEPKLARPTDRESYLSGAFFLPSAQWDGCGKARFLLLFQTVAPTGCTLVSSTSKFACEDKSIKVHYYRCERGRCAPVAVSRRTLEDDTDPNKKKRKCRRKRPVLAEGDERCPFNFTLCRDLKSGRCFFPRQGIISGCLGHRGHMSLGPHVQTPTYAIAATEMELIVQHLRLNGNPSIIRSLYDERNDFGYLSADQIRHLKRSWVSNPPYFADNMSPAERLVARLAAYSPILKFRIYTVHEDAVKGRLTIRCTTRRRGITTITELPGETAALILDSAKDILEALSIGPGKDVLLLAIWATNDGIKQFVKYPHLLALDSTFGTNKEKRPLARGTAKNTKRNNLPVFNCFLPSEQNWVWNWIFQVGLPAIMPRGLLSKVRLVLTDGDQACYSMLEEAIIAKFLPNAQHRLCSWHKINRNYLMKAKTHSRNGSVVDDNFTGHVCAWLSTIVTYVETEHEEKETVRQFREWLELERQNKIVGSKAVAFAETFFQVSFEPHLRRLSFRHFVTCPGGGYNTTSMCESENKRLKYSPLGTKPQQSVDAAATATIAVENTAYWDLEGAAYRTADLKSTSSLAFEVTLSQRLNLVAVDHLVFEWEQKYRLRYMQIHFGPNPVFAVRSWKQKQSYGPEVTFERTRLLTMHEGEYLDCTCGTFQRTGMACRHVFCVIERDPTFSDCSYRYDKYYDALHGNDQVFTAKANIVLASEKKWVYVGPKPRLRRDTRSTKSTYKKALSWFEEALDPDHKPLLVRKAAGNSAIDHITGSDSHSLSTIPNFNDYDCAYSGEYGSPARMSNGGVRSTSDEPSRSSDTNPAKLFVDSELEVACGVDSDVEVVCGVGFTDKKEPTKLITYPIDPLDKGDMHLTLKEQGCSPIGLNPIGVPQQLLQYFLGHALFQRYDVWGDGNCGFYVFMAFLQWTGNVNLNTNDNVGVFRQNIRQDMELKGVDYIKVCCEKTGCDRQWINRGYPEILNRVWDETVDYTTGCGSKSWLNGSVAKVICDFCKIDYVCIGQPQNSKSQGMVVHSRSHFQGNVGKTESFEQGFYCGRTKHKMMERIDFTHELNLELRNTTCYMYLIGNNHYNWLHPKENPPLCPTPPPTLAPTFVPTEEKSDTSALGNVNAYNEIAQWLQPIANGITDKHILEKVNIGMRSIYKTVVAYNNDKAGGKNIGSKYASFPETERRRVVNRATGVYSPNNPNKRKYRNKWNSKRQPRSGSRSMKKRNWMRKKEHETRKNEHESQMNMSCDSSLDTSPSVDAIDLTERLTEVTVNKSKVVYELLGSQVVEVLEE